MKRKLPVKLWDIVVILLALTLTGASAYSIYIKERSSTQVTIEGPRQKWVFPIEAEETINVKGLIGTTVIKIHGNEAWVESSPCDNQVCVRAGHLSENFDFAACLPNNVMLMVEGKKKSNEIDTTSK